MLAGTLFIVATPIGNLEDITLRALRTLAEVSLIAAEDTRHSQKLLTHFGISGKLTSYHDHNKEEKAEVLVARLKEGESVALVSDAGTPGISDPGYYLINRAVEEGIAVVPVPGVTAAMAAISVSGLPTDAFVFEGFLPQKQSRRKARLEELKAERRTIIIYEAPHRINACLRDAYAAFGDRRAALARELTKIHEEILRGKISDILREVASREPRGEYTLVIEGAREKGPGEEVSVLSLADHVEKLIREEGLTRKDAVEKVAKLRGVPRKTVYNESIKTKG